uniref:Peptidase M12B domain-containing protein n=1 Tax=Amblyomma maculatum TaxID=34609 RepID=G3MNM7_AMBMU
METMFFWLLVGCTLTHIGSQCVFAEYSVTVYPEVYEERQNKYQKLLVIHDGYSLNLKRASVLADTVLLRDTTNDGIVDKYVSGAHYEKHLYTDEISLASLFVTPHSEGHYQIIGVLNSTHRIEPLIYSGRSSEGRILHRISRIGKEDGFHAAAKSARNKLEERISAKSSQAGTLPKNFTVELCFVSDSEHTKKFENSSARIQYVILFMLSVSLQLQQLKPPGSIMLKEIQGTSRGEQPYIVLTDDKKILAHDTLKELPKHTWRIAAFRRSDALYIATSRDAAYHHNGSISSALLGLAYVKGACSDDRKFAIGEDNVKGGLFSGVHTATHELGHLLGANHDGYKESIKCEAKYGYAMNPYAGGIRSYLFSKCSEIAIRDFIRSKQGNCLKEVISFSWKQYLPQDHMPQRGGAWNGTKYCELYFPNRNASYVPTNGEDNCSFRSSIPMKKNHSEKALVITPDGSPCYKMDSNRKCINGFCMR